MATYTCDEKGAVREKRTLTLKSSDNQEFMISEPAAFLSETIKSAVAEDCALGVILLPNVDSKTLAKVINYLNKHVEDGSDAILDDEEKRNFDKEFVSGEEMNDLFNLAMAANYLNVKGLQDIVSEKIADMIRNKSLKWMRETFGIQSDYTPEEEEMIRQEHAWAWKGVDPDDY